MSMRLDRELMAKADRARCGCPIMDGLVAHMIHCCPVIKVRRY